MAPDLPTHVYIAAVGCTLPLRRAVRFSPSCVPALHEVVAAAANLGDYRDQYLRGCSMPTLGPACPLLSLLPRPVTGFGYDDDTPAPPPGQQCGPR
eukprot:576406-Pyramimonas_sp.AAC.1